jgi:hypothetical protein
MEWHREVISDAVERALDALRQRSILAPFYLAGGTALALHLGHRRSLDLDFFCGGPFDSERLLGELPPASDLSVTEKAPETLHVSVHGTRVSFLAYRYPVLFPFEEFLGVRVADLRDIACMKISAISGRGARRDFVDLYAACGRYGLEPLLALFRQKYARVNYSMLHVLKSLAYFEDAEKEPMPDLLAPLDWEQVKRYFTGEARGLGGVTK